MKGRGVRTIGDEQLRTVTPNAVSKDLFYLVDAVGVTESEKFVPKPGEKMPPVNPTLKELLEKITHGYLPNDYLRLLASRLSRINAKSEEKHRIEFANLTSTTMHELAMTIFNAFEQETHLPEFISSNEPNIERKALVALLSNNPSARKYLLVLNAGFVKILTPGEDELIYTGFSNEEAASTTQAFEKYVREHKDEIEALRIIYNNQSLPITYAMLMDLKQKLLSADTRFKQAQLWNFYSIVNKGKVIQLEKNEREILTNLIQLVRYAFGQISDLRSLPSLAAQRFELWCGQNQRPLTESQKEIMKQIVGYIVANGTYTNEDLREENMQVFAQLVKNFGAASVVEEVLESLSGWMLAS
jgi:type I restriction enzyme R subunit